MSYKQPAELPPSPLKSPFKDRSKTPSGDMVVEPKKQNLQQAFLENYENQMQSQKADVRFWRVEGNSKLVLQGIGSYPTFYEAHCYIVLKSWIENEEMRSEVHVWVGSHVPQKLEIEVLVKVSDALKMPDSPRVYRQSQFYESKEFMEMFKTGIRYLRGSSDQHNNFEGEKFVKRLFKVKGKNFTRIIEVPLTAESLNNNNSFILTDEWTYYCWNGRKSSEMERIKALEIARQRRDEIAAGMANILIIDDGVESKEKRQFYDAISGDATSKTIKYEAEDADFQTTTASNPMLFRMTDKDHNWMVHAQEITTQPLYKHLLKSETYYILDPNNKSTLYIWVGKKTSHGIKMEAFTNALSYIQATKNPPGITVCRLMEGNETGDFQSHFADWPVRKVSFSLKSQSESVEVGEDGSTFRQSFITEVKDIPVEAVQVTTKDDDASGAFQVWRIEEFNRVKWPKEYYGVFYQTDCYLIMYKIPNKDEHIIYIWQGRFTTDDEIVYSMHAAQKLDDSIGGKATQVRVANGHEPEHFLKLFKGKLIVLLAGKGANEHEDKMFFKINGDNEFNTRALQVTPQASILQSDSCFLLKREGKNYLWNGKLTTKEHRDAAELVADRIAPNGDLIICQEGFEREMFWYQLGGKKDYNKTSTRSKQRSQRDPRLFHCTETNGKFMVKEVNQFDQGDLASDEVMILDTDYEVFVWVGTNASTFDKQQCWKTAKKYVAASGKMIENITITQVKQGSEPRRFTMCFKKWDQERQDTVSYNDLKKLVLDENNRNRKLLQQKTQSAPSQRKEVRMKKDSTGGSGWLRYYGFRMFMGDPE